ncbi:glycosyltransferase family 2 protein [Alkaliflexus imshenetskii]|uniref:glycosyltransferase family 2 protein n=1 Tax=Alkaliflexus imshenetskii TaxID=286730 RepID=UPI00047B33D2|nr:glycosyltransferase family 2 protein [Alkaliflexus imshenetskii]
MKISVVINTYNAEQHLDKVLESVKSFDEVVICDMHSTDRTIEIAQKYGCRIVYHAKEKYVEPARNFAIQQAQYDWILVVDADEVIPAALKEYLYNQLDKKDCPAGIFIPRKNYFMGRFMRIAYPDYNLRFVKKDATFWPPYIHSHPIIEGKIIKIPAKYVGLAMEHLANDRIEQILTKNNVYSSAEVVRRANQKVSIGHIIVSPFFRFIKLYFFKGGFRDGMPGFLFSIYKAQYKFDTLAKMAESQYRN